MTERNDKLAKDLAEAVELLKRWGRARTGMDPYPYDETAELLQRLAAQEKPNAKADLAPASGAQVQRLVGQTEPRETKL